MAHQLAPTSGQPYLSPDEVVRRLRDEFAYVDADQVAGADTVELIIDESLRIGAPGEIIEAHRSAREQTLGVVIADDPTGETSLQFLVMPGEDLFISYQSGQHEDATSGLLHRCAEALGYEIELI